MYHGSEVRRLNVPCFNCRNPIPLWLPTGTPCITCFVCKAINWIGAYPPPVHQQLIHAPHEPKKAVICGILYKKSDREQRLKGCINDAKLMRDLLINQFNFPESSIIMLTEEEETQASRLPTKKNIMEALKWLVEDCQPGDSLFFHYSGHGSQQKNNIKGEEVDGYDEILSPMDFKTVGHILDDDINDTIVKPLPQGVKLHAVIDTCSSGTALDLPFLCRMGRDGTYKWEDHRPRSGAPKGTKGGEAILFSGCDDSQYSYDVPSAWWAPDTSITGAMTISFIKAIDELGVGATYGSILISMRKTIASTINNGAVKSFLKEDSLGDRVYNKRKRCSLGDAIKSVLRMLQEHGSSAGSSVGWLDLNRRRQEPQLSSDHEFKIHTKGFFL